MNPFLALEKAKDAIILDRKLTRHRETNELPKHRENELSYAVKFHLAIIYEKNGMYSEAIETYSSILEEKRFKPHMARIRINMGNIYYEQQKYTQAIKMFRIALDHASRGERKLRCSIHRTIGNIYVEVGRLRDAILDYEAVSMSSNADIDTCFNLLLCYVQTGNINKAKQTFSKMMSIARSPSRGLKKGLVPPISSQLKGDRNGTMTPSSSVELELHEELGKTQKDSMTSLITAAMLVSSMHHEDGIKNENNRSTHGTRHDWKQGYEWVTGQVKDILPSIADHIEMEFALQHLRKNDYVNAIKMLKSFESKDIEIKAMVATNLSFVYSLEGNHAVADDYANVALASNRFNPNALVNKGNSLFVLEEYDKAKELYLEAIGVDSTNFEAMYNLGLTNVRLGFKEEAIQSFEKLHSIAPGNDPRVLYQVATLCEQGNDPTAAMKWFNIISARIPTDPGVLFRIGSLLNDLNDEGQSFHYHLESYRFYPSNLDTIGWLAIWFVKLEMYDEAVHYFKSAAEIQPNEIKWKFTLGSCFRKMGRNLDALKLYEDLHKEYPKDIECKVSNENIERHDQIHLFICLMLQNFNSRMIFTIGLRYLISVCKELGLPYDGYEEVANDIQKKAG